MLKKNRLYFLFVFLIGCTAGWIFYEYSVINDHSNEPLPVIQNDKNDIFYGETLYPEQIKAVIKNYDNKYNVNIFFVETEKEFVDILDKTDISNTQKAFFQYNEWHKYGFIFVKYNGIDYCICVDTIPTLSNYTKKLIIENNNLFINFRSKKYQVMMFGENLQKAQKVVVVLPLPSLNSSLKTMANIYLKY